MADEFSGIRERLRQKNREFQGLEQEHQRLKVELNKLIRHKTLTPQEEIQKKQIQVEKLRMKDQIALMLRRHGEEERSLER